MTAFSIRAALRATILIVSLLAGSAAVTRAAAKADVPSAPGPWKQSQLIAPRDLTHELANSGGKKPVIVCVGFQFLYQGAHIPGAIWEGPARDAAGIAKLKQWARSVPKGAPVIIYCGCCPFYRCPNVRPAFKALREAGLTNIRVLYIEDDFAKDWVAKGYPVQKGD